MSFEVAIIGAGLSGLFLAVALHGQSIPCTVYESRPDAPLNIGGAIMLSPNALRVLDKFDVYERIRTRGYNFTHLDYRDATSNEVIEVQEFGSKPKYGYEALRIYRTELINVLLEVLQELGVPIKYGHKFIRILGETEDGVTWEFANGVKGSATVLVGSDGIHSTVRRYLYPDLATKFVGMAGITAAVPTAQLEAPADLHFPLTYVLPSKGSAFVIAPQQADGSEVLIGKQRRLDKDLTREEWAAFMGDKESLIKYLQDNDAGFPDVVHRAVSKITPDKINVWPFYVVPKLTTWSSDDKHRHVLILGDAAHAIPPSAGQGINQAFEDVYMLAAILGINVQQKELPQDRKKRLLADSLKFWQQYRQGRVDQVLELNKQIDLRRLPQGQVETAKLDFNLEWLYNPDLDEIVREWFKKWEA